MYKAENESRAAIGQLEMDETRLARLINDASIDQVQVVDTNLQVIAWNKTSEQISGIPKEAAIGKPLTEIYEKMPEFPAIMDGIRNGLKGFKSFVPWDKGGYIKGYFEHHFIPLREGPSDKVLGVLIIIHDVAHRIKAEKELQELNKQLDKKNKELQRKTEELANFNWVASHDLKEPLRKVYTFIEMVATKEGMKVSDAARTNLRRAQSAVQRLGLLTDDIVTFSQVTAPKDAVEEVDLQSLLESELSRHERDVEERQAIIEADPLPRVTGYQHLLSLLLHHMLSNALKFHADGARPRVKLEYKLCPGREVHAAEAEADASYHCLIFTDNGIGFGEEYTEKIFGMFQRLHAPGTYRGTGMGLPICRKVVEAHDGFITVKSEEGVGSIFSCYIKDIS